MHLSLIFEIFIKASWLVKGVMLTLLLMSITSWTLILNRYFRLARAKRMDRLYERIYQDQGGSFTAIKKTLDDYPRPDRLSGLPRLFLNGYELVTQVIQFPNQSAPAKVEYINKNLNAKIVEELDDQDFGLSTLSIITGISPYIGLFGTVWGIIEVFTSIGAAEQVNIQAIAPGISEALVATAMGLFVAIPALIFYNVFHKRVNLNENRYYNFSDSFVATVQEHVFRHTAQQQQQPPQG